MKNAYIMQEIYENNTLIKIPRALLNMRIICMTTQCVHTCACFFASVSRSSLKNNLPGWRNKINCVCELFLVPIVEEISKNEDWRGKKQHRFTRNIKQEQSIVACTGL